MTADFEQRVRQTGLQLYQLAEGQKPSIFKKDYWTGKVMDWSMKNETFKQEMFRFVDVFPCLTRPESVAKHLQEYFCQPGQDFPKSMQWGLKRVKPDSMAAKLAAKSITKNINAMGKQFITGADLKEAAPVMKKLRDQGVAWTVKILKEAVTSAKDEAVFLEAQMALMNGYHEIHTEWPALGGGEGDLDWGFTPKINVSLMASCLFSQYINKACAFDYAVDMALERLRPIYRKAIALNAYVMMDMEHLPAREFSIALFKKINEEGEFRDYPHKGIAYQAYMRDCEPVLEDLLSWSREAGQNFGIRLVKGAFWDEEVVLANQFNAPVPVFTNKHETDAAYEACAKKILKNHAYTMLKCASHNVRTVAYTVETARDLRVPDERLEFQMLHGMAENLRAAWVKAGLHLRLYAPVGEIIPGMAYLARRLLENTSNESFLRQSFAEGVARETLLRNPVELAQETAASPEPQKETSAYGGKGPFRNEPPFEWTAENRRLFATTLKDVRARFPIKTPLCIGDRLVTHPHVAFTAFTGSRDVGLRVIEQAGKTTRGVESVKKVIAEMGGKNAIIVDADADLDQAVGPIIQSAFSYQGQKCSACSRLIVLEENYDKFLYRFKNSVETLIAGLSEDPKTDLGAVIDEAAKEKIEAYIDMGKKEGQMLTQPATKDPVGHFVPPTVFVNIPLESKLMQEEIFGPVVCVTKVKDFDEALKVANSTSYALTGGVFSRSPANIEKACREFQVGNLYINRAITGALVQRHPFGGYKMSGIGAKAMGPGYLPQFMHVRTIVENTFRSGFAPMDD